MLDVIKPFSKAIAGAVGGAITMYLAKHNVIIDDELRDSFEVFLGAVVTFVVVYLAPKNTASK